MFANDSWIMRLAGKGCLNTVNDTYIGGAPAGSSALGFSQYPGQLGKTLSVSQEQIAQLTDTTIGTLYGGRYRYVKFRAADTVPVVGQLAFWDTTATAWQSAYQVTTSETRSSVANAIFIAGVFISAPTAGNYCFIQDLGDVLIKFRAALTAAGAVGSQCYAAAVGGADAGLADVIASGAAATFNDVSLLQARFLGNAVTAPAAGVLSQVTLGFHNVLG